MKDYSGARTPDVCQGSRSHVPAAGVTQAVSPLPLARKAAQAWHRWAADGRTALQTALHDPYTAKHKPQRSSNVLLQIHPLNSQDRTEEKITYLIYCASGAEVS